MDALCNGSSDGSATVTSSGGTAPYTYLWDDGQTTAMAGALSAGSYTVTVTDANGCTESQSVSVLEPIVLSSTVSSMDALCNGSSDGSATVTSSGGTAPYTYLWDDGQTTAMASIISWKLHGNSNRCQWLYRVSKCICSGTNCTIIYGFIYGCFV